MQNIQDKEKETTKQKLKSNLLKSFRPMEPSEYAFEWGSQREREGSKWGKVFMQYCISLKQCNVARSYFCQW